MSRFIILLCGFLLCALSAGVEAIEFDNTPVEDAFRMQLFAAADDDFGSFEGSESDTLADEDLRHGGVRQVSIARAGLYSALLPGLGEYYVGHKTKAKYFFAAEALTWIGYFGFRTYGSWREDDMIDFGAVHANAQLDGKGDEFLDMVGFYDDIEQYNTLGRVFDPERPYYPDTPEFHWRWDSPDSQREFRDIKNSSRQAFRNADFMIGIAIASRVISVIDAVRDARRARNRISDDSFSNGTEGYTYSIRIDPLSENNQVSLVILTPF